MGIANGKIKENQVDPLFVILEQHLCNFKDPDIDRKTFIAAVVAEYLGYLRNNNITVPRALEQPVIEELANQVNTMLVKRIYGCLTIEDFQRHVPDTTKKRAKTRYSKLSSR